MKMKVIAMLAADVYKRQASFRVISSAEGACGAFASNPQPQRPVSRERKAFCLSLIHI